MADVDRVSVVGNSRTVADDVVVATGIVLGQPLLDLDLETSRRRVGQLPWVADVEIDRNLNGDVIVTVQERKPTVALPTDDGYVLIDETGYQLESVADQPDEFIPVVGIEASGQPGDYAPQEATLVLNFVHGVTPTLRPQTRQLTIEDDGLVVELAAGARVILGDSSQLGEKFQSLETVLARVDLNCVSIIDLRVPSAAAVRRSESAEGACI